MPWKDADLAKIRRRYTVLARFYPLFNFVFWLPLGIRARAVRALRLYRGDTVLEVGCGTGRNLPYLERAVGPGGRIIALDATPAMITRAERLCARRGWTNVTFMLEDAKTALLPMDLDAALFSLSYAVIPESREVLARVWASLKPGGQLVIMDGKLPEGLLGKVLGPIASAMSRATVLGNPYKRAWVDLEELAGAVEMDEIWPGTYFVCSAEKPAPRWVANAPPEEPKRAASSPKVSGAKPPKARKSPGAAPARRRQRPGSSGRDHRMP
jgi:demethylmenaquinone methyltransferase/2-methoxy-6-polyprenyl-1,4-benzoquinol methylase